MMKSFIHLRTHSDYSLLESSIKINALVNLCVQHSMPALALTDSGNLFGSLEFADCAANSGVKPIIGCNVMVSQCGSNVGSILLLAKNNQGYNNLVSIISDSFKEKLENQVNLVDIKQLFYLSEGLIVLTGAHDGILAQFLSQKNKNVEIVDNLLSIFKNNIYVELQRHGLEYGDDMEKKFIDFAYEQNLPLVATNDVFFAKKEDFQAHDILSCIAEGNYAVQEDRKRLTPEHYFKSAEEMQELFSDIPEAINNTILIAQRCSFMPEVRKPILPHFPCSEGRTEGEELTIQSKTGLEQRIRYFALNENIKQQYYERLEYELKVIISMDYSGYFLIVSDFICWSKNNDIPVGPGRGSGAGSLVAWSLQITDLDPIKFGLIFERFLNPERISMPDFDIDFCQEKRDLVIEYIRKKYGYVAHIITFGKLQAKAVLRDVGRVMQIPYMQVDRICKMIPHNPINPVTLSEAINMDKNLQKERDSDVTVAKLLEISLKLEGLYRHASTHAAGIVICDRKLEDLIPIYYDQSSSLPITQYNMKYVEKAGLVKFDFLGLRTLTVIDQICHLIRNRGIDIDISKIPLNDKKTYNLLSTGNSIGVFQLESSGMREVIRKLKPDSIEDIIALISLYRPGPMDNIAVYIARKHGLEEPDYIHPLLENVLKETFGVIIYQEQVIEIARVLAGYSLGSADLLRRAMGKKIKEEMDKQRKSFVDGAIKNGIDKDKARYIFDLVAKFAGYGFNKSHAAAYALISFQTAYLKANYPLEFFTASMNLDINDKDKLGLFCQQAKLHGIKILPPDINYSEVFFSIKENSIRYGLGALKNVGQLAAKEIIDQKKNYKDIWDFTNNVHSKLINKRMFESMVKCGALDSLHNNRRQLFESIEILLNIIDSNIKDINSNQASLFGNLNTTCYSLIDTQDWNEEEKLNEEFAALGFYLTGHPLEKHKYILEKLKINFINDSQSINNQLHRIAGIISNVRMRSTSRGRFAILTLSDPYNIHEIAFYDSKIIENNRDLFNSGLSVIIDMETSDFTNSSRLIGKNIYGFEENIISTIKQLTIKVNSREAFSVVELSSLLKNKGKTKIFINLLLKNNDIKIQLPDNYLVTPMIFNQIMNLKWVKDIIIHNDNLVYNSQH